ncbi:hypothetical protein D1BOALGB6SA_872 [Olavius sp. associated proteobacterium Delta 1]|nr:hypothetical protein D1BOALGB6SA_872 [Olavius sp. associated proteobacterium Delta 1]
MPLPSEYDTCNHNVNPDKPELKIEDCKLNIQSKIVND